MCGRYIHDQFMPCPAGPWRLARPACRGLLLRVPALAPGFPPLRRSMPPAEWTTIDAQPAGPTLCLHGAWRLADLPAIEAALKAAGLQPVVALDVTRLTQLDSRLGASNKVIIGCGLVRFQ